MEIPIYSGLVQINYLSYPIFLSKSKGLSTQNKNQSHIKRPLTHTHTCIILLSYNILSSPVTALPINLHNTSTYIQYILYIYMYGEVHFPSPYIIHKRLFELITNFPWENRNKGKRNWISLCTQKVNLVVLFCFCFLEANLYFQSYTFAIVIYVLDIYVAMYCI